MTKRKETFKEVLLQVFMQGFTAFVILMMLITALIVCIGNWNISRLEEELGVGQGMEYEVNTEYIPVKEQISWYIDTLLISETEEHEYVMEEKLSHSKVQNTRYIEKTTLSDAKLLASLMYHEEGVLLSILPYEDAKRAHMLAGSVVIHRTNMNYKGANSIRDTIFAEGQYAETTLEKLDQPVPDYVVEWAEELLEQGPIGPSDMIYQAEFEQGNGTYDEIHNQFFCTINEIE